MLLRAASFAQRKNSTMKTLFFLIAFMSVLSCGAQTLSDSTKVNRLLHSADSCFVKGDSANAKKYWTEALKLHPWSCLARNGMMLLQGSVLCNCNEKQAAYEYQFDQAKKHYAAKEYEHAEQLYREANALFPSAKLQRQIQRSHEKINR